MTHRIKFVRRFKVKSDSGKQYEILEYQEYDVIQTGGNNTSVIDGLKRWKTTTGLICNYRDTDKTFEIARTGEILRVI
jgi:hypothetical protein